MRILFLASGGGGNFRFVYHANQAFNLNLNFVGLISDRPCFANDFSKQNNIYQKIINYSRNNDKGLIDQLTLIRPDIVITTIHKILSNETLLCNPSIKFINLHYSLLPAFKGTLNMEAVNKAKDLNAQFIGTSTHDVTEEVDAGRLISQSIFQPNWEDDISLIYDTVFKAGCLTLLNTILKQSPNSFNPKGNKSIELNNYEVWFSEELFEAENKLLCIFKKL